ncbi:MAG: PKD domain-containing protein [Pirellulaceae bacterium]|nr:PKD domain-containing protein [Pirellulaceae bacterium]
MKMLLVHGLAWALCLGMGVCLAQTPAGTPAINGQTDPWVRAVDLNVGEQETVTLHNGQKATVKLLSLNETRDPIRDAVRQAIVKVEVNGQGITLESGTYNLPQMVGQVQIDCSITSGYNSNGTPEFWGLDKAARLRLWPAGSTLLPPGAMIYPVKQRFFASATWFDNEPIDGGASIVKKIYYHSGLDIGGTEGLVEIVAATDALVVSSGLNILEEHKVDTPAKIRGDVVYLKDERGWYYRYSHMQSIDPGIVPGRVIKQGTRIGVLGKEGASGGWSHLHFEIVARQPSGKWGTQAGYALIREAYIRQYQPPIIACARSRAFITPGETVTFDGSKSWCANGKIASYQWSFNDGTQSTEVKLTKTYPKPGRYSEVLKVTDEHGHVDYDFAIVLVLDPNKMTSYVQSLHANYYPSLENKVGQPITFKVRAFNATEGEESWDFGDGTASVKTKSDGSGPALNKDGYAIVEHTYQKPGDYLVRIERYTDSGIPAIEHLDVHVVP